MIIFLCGPKGSGKDTVAAEFVKLNPPYQTIAFADPIRDFVMELFQLDTVEEYDEFKRSKVLTTNGKVLDRREIVRGIGMKMLSYDQTQFTRYVEDAIADEYDVIVTDCRMSHEFDLVTNLKESRSDVIVVQIKRTGFEYDGHVTESEPTILMDLVIQNEGSINDSVATLHSFVTRDT